MAAVSVTYRTAWTATDLSAAASIGFGTLAGQRLDFKA
jgi:hypothetical protein